jgi:hypothetical protein
VQNQAQTSRKSYQPQRGGFKGQRGSYIPTYKAQCWTKKKQNGVNTVEEEEEQHQEQHGGMDPDFEDAVPSFYKAKTNCWSHR